MKHFDAMLLGAVFLVWTVLAVLSVRRGPKA